MHAISGTWNGPRRLTPPSSGRRKGRFAPFAPPLMSNVRQHQAASGVRGMPYPIDGGCTCRSVRYRLASAPLFVHCCHCRWCQRESGTAFALNAMIESDRVVNLGIGPVVIDTPSASGIGQKIARCPKCQVAVWSHYAGSGPIIAFVRVGTLDNPDLLPPDVHIFAASKQPWVSLALGTPVVSEYYERQDLWPPQSLERRRAILPLITAYRAKQSNVA